MSKFSSSKVIMAKDGKTNVAPKTVRKHGQIWKAIAKILNTRPEWLRAGFCEWITRREISDFWFDNLFFTEKPDFACKINLIGLNSW